MKCAQHQLFAASNSCVYSKRPVWSQRRRVHSQKKLAAVASAPANTSTESPTGWVELAAWLAQAGGSVGHLRLRTFNSGGGTLRGLAATENVQSGDVLLTVPLRCALLDTEAQRAYEGAPWNVNQAVRLLKEKQTGDTSAFHQYIATLPSFQVTPLLCEQQHFAQLHYVPAVEACRSYQDVLVQAHSDLRAAGVEVSLRELAWALTMVQSRSLRLAQLGVRVMLPAIDMLNHGGSQHATGSLGLSSSAWALDGSKSVCFVSSREMEAGEQVLWTYGDRSNDDFFLYHGFTLRANPFEDVILFNHTHHLLTWTLDNLHTFPTPCVHLPSRAATTLPNTHQPCPTPESIQQLHMELEEVCQQALAKAESATSQPPTPGTCTALLGGLLAAVAGCHGQRGTGGRGASDESAAAVVTAGGVERVLGSFRLHTAEWGRHETTTRSAGSSTAADVAGQPKCSKYVAELSARRDGWVDVRLLAGLTHIISRLVPQIAAGDVAAHMAALLSHRCRELLEAAPTSLAHDRHLMALLQDDSSPPHPDLTQLFSHHHQPDQNSRGPSISTEVHNSGDSTLLTQGGSLMGVLSADESRELYVLAVQYRLEKKKTLQELSQLWQR